MIGIDTGFIPAEMQDSSSGNLLSSIENLPAKTMSKNSSPFTRRNHFHESESLPILGASPKPAQVGSLNLIPKFGIGQFLHTGIHVDISKFHAFRLPGEHEGVKDKK